MLPPPRKLGPSISGAAPVTVMEKVSLVPGSPPSVTSTVNVTGPALLFPVPVMVVPQPLVVTEEIEVLCTLSPMLWFSYDRWPWGRPATGSNPTASPNVTFPPPTGIHPPPVVELEPGTSGATNDKSTLSPEKVTAKLVSVDEIVSSPSTSTSRFCCTLDISGPLS